MIIINVEMDLREDIVEVQHEKLSLDQISELVLSFYLVIIIYYSFSLIIN